MPANLRIQEVSKLSAHSQQLQVPSNASLSTNHATPATPLICFDSNLQSERQSDACRNQDRKTCEALAANGAGEQPRTIEQPLRCPGSALDTLGSRISATWLNDAGHLSRNGLGPLGLPFLDSMDCKAQRRSLSGSQHIMASKSHRNAGSRHRKTNSLSDWLPWAKSL